MKHVDATSGATPSPSHTNGKQTEDPASPNNKTGVPLAHYRARFGEQRPEDIAQRCELTFEEEAFSLTLLGAPVKVSFPEGVATREVCRGADTSLDAPTVLDDVTTILLLRYLIEGAKAPVDSFITYAEMPWGQTYLKQFTGRCITRLALSYGDKLEAFALKAQALGGIASEGGDAAFVVPFLENLQVKLIVWEADEDFASSAQILFSNNFKAAFSAEDLAYVGDIILNALQSR